MPTLRVDDRDVAPLMLALTARARMRGLLGRTSFDGALLLRPARSVHTIGMRFPIDVAHVSENGTVLAVATMAPNRVGAMVRGARQVLEAECGAFARWGVVEGCAVSFGGIEQAAA